MSDKLIETANDQNIETAPSLLQTILFPVFSSYGLKPSSSSGNFPEEQPTTSLNFSTRNFRENLDKFSKENQKTLLKGDFKSYLMDYEIEEIGPILVKQDHSMSWQNLMDTYYAYNELEQLLQEYFFDKELKRIKEDIY